MKKKYSLTLDDNFIKYCEINKITDVEGLAKKLFQRGFTIEKYGETPSIAKGKEIEVIKEVIKEVPVEKIVEVIKNVETVKEVPVEKIVEVVKEVKVEVPVEKIVEVVKEVPVAVAGDTQVIIKEVIKEVPVEVPVEKIVEVVKEVQVEKLVVNDAELNVLKKENEQLKEELNKITSALEKMNKAKYLKGSDLNNLYDE